MACGNVFDARRGGNSWQSQRAWSANGETSSVVAEYEKKDEVLTAYNHCIIQGSLDKPLFLAIKQIKEW